MADANLPMNGQFMYGKTVMNADPRPTEYLIVLEKKTGNKVSLSRKEDFNSKFHSWITDPSAVPVPQAVPVVTETSAEAFLNGVTPPNETDEEKIRREQDMLAGMQARLEELKAEGRVNSPKNPFVGLSGDKKAEYSQLNNALNK
jgi:hypothetical protein